MGEDYRTIEVRQSILADNDADAAELAGQFESMGGLEARAARGDAKAQGEHDRVCL